MRVNLAQRPCKYSAISDHVSQIVRVIYAQGPCCSSSKIDMALQNLSLYHSKKKNATQLRPGTRENRHSCAGATIVSSASRGRLLREIRTFGRAVEGSSVSPLTNTMGGLSGGGRGGDTSRASSAPSFVIAQLRARASVLDLACGTCCPPFAIRKAYTIEGSSTPRRKGSAIR